MNKKEFYALNERQIFSKVDVRLQTKLLVITQIMKTCQATGFTNIVTPSQ